MHSVVCAFQLSSIQASLQCLLGLAGPVRDFQRGPSAQGRLNITDCHIRQRYRLSGYQRSTRCKFVRVFRSAKLGNEPLAFCF